MGLNTKIEWATHTANLWIGCAEVGDGCTNCYARVLNKRWGKNSWGNDVPRTRVKSIWEKLAKYQQLASAAGERHRVFVGSMMDIFEKPMPLVESDGSRSWNGMEEMHTGLLREALFAQISINKYPNLLFLFLTKRPSNINKMIPESWKVMPPVNVMFGTSPVDQKTANTLIPQLLQVNGKRFLSVEPQLDFIDLEYPESLFPGGPAVCCSGRECGCMGRPVESPLIHGIDWVIQGGESGHHRRPFNLDWAYSLEEQCSRNNVAYFFKQIDKVLPIPEDLLIRQFPVI